jgi:hypothetical protein
VLCYQYHLLCSAKTICNAIRETKHDARNRVEGEKNCCSAVLETQPERSVRYSDPPSVADETRYTMRRGSNSSSFARQEAKASTVDARWPAHHRRRSSHPPRPVKKQLRPDAVTLAATAAPTPPHPRSLRSTPSCRAPARHSASARSMAVACGALPRAAARR